MLLKIITSPFISILLIHFSKFITSPGNLGIFALEFEGPLLNVSHEMFHSFLHCSRKVSDLAARTVEGPTGPTGPKAGFMLVFHEHKLQYIW